MFISDKLVYIQLQKTGCTHIAKLLADLFKGKQIRKHGCATPDQIKEHDYFVSSIRNPWDWYLSLWTFGAQGRGSLRRNLTTKQALSLPHIARDIAKSPKKGIRKWSLVATKNTKMWQSLRSQG